MVKKGINVALGTDSTAINDDDDMLQEMRLAARLHQQPGIDSPAINSHQVLRMATLNAAQSTFFHNQIGSLESGRRADVVLMDLTAMEAPYMDPDISVIETLLYRGKVQHVDTVIIDGEVVLQGGKFTRFNKEDVAKELHERYAHLDYPEVAKTRLMVHRLLPHVKDFYRDWQPKVGRPHYQYNSRT
jgi:cytosine/adenosine deaminase-related metal-dependent hydrolase